MFPPISISIARVLGHNARFQGFSLWPGVLHVPKNLTSSFCRFLPSPSGGLQRVSLSVLAGKNVRFN